MIRKTAFHNPLVRIFFKAVANVWFSTKGWSARGELGDHKKMILVAAPHTSNWDFVYMLLIAFKVDLKLVWMVKDTVFKTPILGSFANWGGGIPIDRNSAHNVVDQMVTSFNETEEMLLVNTPEGTRSKRDRWKTGFYHIATKAQVPIQLAGIHFTEKHITLGPVIFPSGDREADFKIIADFFKDFEGKHHENYTPPIK